MKTTGIFKINVLLAGVCALACLNADAIAQSRNNRNRRTQADQQSSSAPTLPAVPGQGFDAFRMARTRNIFDPDRRPIVQASSQPSRQQSPPPTRSDYVALTGTMVTEERALAFFSGSRSEYNKVLAADANIAGAKIAKITATGIEVERAGKKVTVTVGQTVPLDDSAPTAPPAATSPAGTSSTTDTAPSAPSAVPADASDLLKQMMERRQKELK
jgi:hypothetical protein